MSPNCLKEKTVQCRPLRRKELAESRVMWERLGMEVVALFGTVLFT